MHVASTMTLAITIGHSPIAGAPTCHSVTPTVNAPRIGSDLPPMWPVGSVSAVRGTKEPVVSAAAQSPPNAVQCDRGQTRCALLPRMSPLGDGRRKSSAWGRRLLPLRARPRLGESAPNLSGVCMPMQGNGPARDRRHAACRWVAPGLKLVPFRTDRAGPSILLPESPCTFFVAVRFIAALVWPCSRALSVCRAVAVHPQRPGPT